LSNSHVRRFFQAEAGAAVLWVVASLMLAAVMAPWLYEAGKNLALRAASHDLGAFSEWLGAAAGRARFGRFFSRALVVSAVLLLPLLCWRVRAIRRVSGIPTEILPPGWLKRWQLAGLGFLITGLSLGVLVLILRLSGALIAAPHAPSFGRLLSSVTLPSVVTPLIEEWLFRGLLLGLFLKCVRPMSACVGCSLLFAFLHFLEPPTGVVIANPAAIGAGFEMLGKMLFHFVELRFFVTDFATLWVIGMILGWARVQTGGLAFSIGLHSGWIFAFKAGNLYFNHVTTHPLSPWGIGGTMRSGLLPLMMLGFTALICRALLRRDALANPASR
jgi:uncharacterized protein